MHLSLQTGFNAGHSSFYFLTARRDVIVTSFDISTVHFVRPMITYLERKFHGRLTVVIGDSRQTVAPYFAANSTSFRSCDLMYVDGSHHFEQALSDMLNFARVASQPHNVIIADDVDLDGSGRAWYTLMQSGIVKQLFSCTYYGKNGKSFAVGVVRQHNK